MAAALLELPEIIGCCSEITRGITERLGDIEGCETDDDLVAAVLRAAREYALTKKGGQ